jgi:hypothetical protein
MGGVVSAAGSALGIGGGNTPRFDPETAKYTMRSGAFGPTNKDVEKNIKKIGTTAQNNVAGIDQRENRDRQGNLASALEAQMAGQGPSVAQSQLQQATDRNLAQQLAMAASSRGANAATTQRQLMQNQAATNQVAAQQAADTRVAEQLNAQQMYGTLATNMREQDAAAQNTAIGQQMQTQNEIAAIRDANRAAQMSLETNRMNQSLGVGGLHAQDTMNRRDNRTSIVQSGISSIGQGASGIAGLAMMSDEDVKTNVKDGSKAAYDFLEALEAKKYNYKEPDKFGKGERLGVMAQDVEDGGPMGAQIVDETPEGKAVDMAKGFGAVLAAQSEMHKRLKQLEGRKAKKA